MSETNLIANRWQTSLSGKTRHVINPAYNRPIREIADSDAADVDAAVRAAAQAFPRWSHASGRERAQLLHDAMSIFRSRYLEESARLLTQENGKPLSDSLKEVRYTADVIDFYADEARRITGTHFAGDMGSTHSFVFKQPLGVAAAILPWNFPVDLLAWKLGPGLAAGCTFVVKPSEEAPLSTIPFVQAFLDAGLPEGVINVVMGGGVTGAALVDHPGVAKIAFTGSVDTGVRIAQAAAKNMKRTTLELGGSAPCLVFADADLEAAVKGALRRCYSHTGQICISVNRIFVQAQIFEAFVERYAELASKLTIAADGLLEPDADMGPMINAAAVDKVRQHVEDAAARGGRVIVGGDAPRAEKYAGGGFFFAPTVIIDVTAEMRVMREETFGPVAPIASFVTAREAVEAANATPYGLAAYVYTRDLDTAFHCARSLRCGGVGINVNDITDIRGPFGGAGMSGIGRELGEPGIDSYLETKHVRLAYGSMP
ncbi:MAG: aldehyde dehydrogenase family protein [Anaerolineae bacterium]|nr:aldehyde dehydrogenase family protein [Anaerolineae bacterium]